MIDILTIASGSAGNCYRVSDGETAVLIDCGIQLSEIRKALGFKLSEIAGCLLSHVHLDHSRSADKMLRAGIDCWMSEATRQPLGVSGHRVHVFDELKLFRVGTWDILPFPLQHDVENHGFLMQSRAGGKVCYITDSYFCRFKFPAVTHYLIECNYAKDILEANIEAGITPAEIRNRITRSHFELEDVKAFFRANDLASVREIHLIHGSRTNGDPARFKREIEEVTGKPVCVAGMGGADE